MFSDNVFSFAGVSAEVVKLLVIHQGESFVLDGNSGVFRLGGLALTPAKLKTLSLNIPKL
jgi:hypothetical protein